MSDFFRRKFNRKMLNLLFLILIIFGTLFGGYNVFATKSMNPVANWLGVSKEELDDRFLATGQSDVSMSPINNYDEEDNNLANPSVWLVKIANDFLIWTVSEKLYNEVFFSDIAKEGITQAWEAVRGFINMFYLLILVFLAITTILRINKFNDKKLFFNVIVSAILVNFSMAITLVVIDFSNLIMMYFASAIQGVDPVNHFFKEAGMSKNYIGDADANWLLENGSKMIGFIINIIMAVMILFTAISLLIRLIAYWVLIILSPLAFFSIAIPGSNGFKEWSDKLIHYSFYGPIMLFFIWLALALSSYLNQAFTHANEIGGLEGFMKFLTSYIMVLYLLYYGHDKSKTMASKAGDFAGKIMDKGGQYAVKAGKGAATLGVVPAAQLAAKTPWAKAEFAGMKARMNEGKWTRLATKEGREEAQGEKDFDAKLKYASGDKKQALEMQRAEKTLSGWKEGGKDIENEDVLASKLRSGNVVEQQAAALQLAKLGKLGIDSTGNRYTDAKKVVSKNKFLDKAIERSAGGNSKVAQYMHHYNNSTSTTPSTTSTEFVDKKITAAIEAYNNNLPTTPAGVAARVDATNNSSRRNFINSQFGGNKRSAMVAGVLSGLNSNADVAKLINEQKQGATATNVADDVSDYLTHTQLGGRRFSGRGIEIIKDQSHGVAQAVLRNRGV